MRFICVVALIACGSAPRNPSSPPTRDECREALVHAFALAPVAGSTATEYVGAQVDQCVGQATLAWARCTFAAATKEELERCGCARDPTMCRR